MPSPSQPVEPVPSPDRQDPTPAPKQAQSAPCLLPQHAALLVASAITAEVIEARGYRSAIDAEQLQQLNFNSHQRCVPSFIPLRGLDGNVCLHQARPDQPRKKKNKDGKWAKYELPQGSKRVIDVPPAARAQVLNAEVPLFVTVGVRQADAAVSNRLCCMALLGNGGWRNQEAFWDQVPLAGRVVHLVFDSDMSSRIEVRRQAAELKEFLEARHAVVHVVRLPSRSDDRRWVWTTFSVPGTWSRIFSL